MTNTRKFSKKQEDRVAKATGGKRVANSGATVFRKGDVNAGLFCIECKTAITRKKSMSILEEWITKLKEEAFAMRKPFWAIAFNFGGLDNRENFYIISEDLFVKLSEMLQEENQ